MSNQAMYERNEIIMNRHTLLPLLLLCALLLTSCGEQAKEIPLPGCEELAQQILQGQTFSEEMSALSETKLQGALDLTGDEYTDASMIMDVSRTTAEAIIVLTAKDEAQSKALQEKLESYRTDTLRQYQDYRPEEAPKLESAKVMVKGLQCVLVIAPDQAAAQTACDTAWGN